MKRSFLTGFKILKHSNYFAFGILDEDVLQLFIIKDKCMVSKIVLSPSGYIGDFPPCMKNCNAFEMHFCVMEKQIKGAIDESDLIKTSQNFAKLFDLPFDLSFDDIDESVEPNVDV